MKSYIKKQRKQIMAEILKTELLASSGDKAAEEKLKDLGNQLSALDPRKSKKEYTPRKDALVTKEIIALAEQYGTKERTLYYRVYNLNMDPVKAAKMPTRRKRKTVPWNESGLTVEKYLYRKHLDILDHEILEEFNISMKALNTFKKEYQLWETDLRKMEQLKPLESKFIEEFDEFGKRIYPAEIFEIANAHNVKKQTFITRVYMGWDYQKAATYPVRKMNKKRRA